MTALAETNNPPMSGKSLRNTKYTALCISYCAFLFLFSACSPTATPTLFIPPSSPLTTPTTAVSISFSAPTTPIPSATLAATVTATPAAAQIVLTPQPASATGSPPATATTDASATPAPACADSIKFLADVNYPDNTVVAPGSAIEKQWRVQNLGACDWDGRYRLKLVEGFPSLGAPAEMALYPARAGTKAIIAIKFTAPQEPGTYNTYWQAYDPSGAAFGEAIYMLIVVQP